MTAPFPYASPKGGPVQLLVATAILSDAQVKALPTTPVVILAGIAGVALIPVLATIRLDAAAGAYTNVDAAATIDVEWSVGPANAGVSKVLNTPIAAAANNVIVTGALTNANLAGTSIARANLVGAGLSIVASNAAAGDFTGGNAANQLKVQVYYLAVVL